jgi:hypothetical protein
LLIPLPSECGFWNRVSSVVLQREEKERICTFFFRARSFRFFVFSLFKKERAPTSNDLWPIASVFLPEGKEGIWRIP